MECLLICSARVSKTLKGHNRHNSGQMKTEKIIEIQPVRPTEVCGKVLGDKNDYKPAKTSLSLSNVIDADYQNSCLFTNKGHFS